MLIFHTHMIGRMDLAALCRVWRVSHLNLRDSEAKSCSIERKRPRAI